MSVEGFVLHGLNVQLCLKVVDQESCLVLGEAVSMGLHCMTAFLAMMHCMALLLRVLDAIKISIG